MGDPMTAPASPPDLEALEARLLDAKVAFGLRQQGKYERVADMRAKGESWESIGEAIGPRARAGGPAWRVTTCGWLSAASYGTRVTVPIRAPYHRVSEEAVKLWLDDYRPAPEGWEWVRSGPEFKARIERAVEEGERIEAMSLDHDLAEDHYRIGGDRTATTWTGYDCLTWVLETYPAIVPRGRVTVHSMNPAGAARMREALRDWEDLPHCRQARAALEEGQDD